MYFSPQPKTNLKDFFNYREELNKLKSWIKDENVRMIVIKGLRRVGKTSLLNIGLKASKVDFIKIDARSIEPNRKAFAYTLLKELQDKNFLSKYLLKKIKSINLGVLSLQFEWEDDLRDILKRSRFVLAIDEVQRFEKTDIDSFLSWIYDNTNIKLIFSGSEIGILDKFIGLYNPKKPFYGRAYNELEIHRLSNEKSKEFLTIGFKQLKKDISDNEIEEVIHKLDGIIGWLSLYGYYRINLNHKQAHKQALNKTIEIGKNIVKEEFLNFLSTRKASARRYLSIMRAVSFDHYKWKDIKDYSTLYLKHELYDAQFTHLLKTLVDFGFIVQKDGNYYPADPVIKETFRGNFTTTNL